MSDLNNLSVTGRLVRDPEMRYTPQGTAVADFTIAVNRYTKDENGNYDSDFFDVTCWQKTAEYVSNYLRQGNKVSIAGRLQQRKWVDAETGKNRSKISIVATDVNNLTPRPLAEAEEDAEGDPTAEPEVQAAPPVTRTTRAAAANAAPVPQARAAAPAARATNGRGATATAPAPRRQAAPPVEEIDEDPFADE